MSECWEKVVLFNDFATQVKLAYSIFLKIFDILYIIIHLASSILFYLLIKCHVDFSIDNPGWVPSEPLVFTNKSTCV